MSVLLTLQSNSWHGGQQNWKQAGSTENVLGRGDVAGWRFSEGILVFGGVHDDDVDAKSALHLDNTGSDGMFTNAGGLLARIKMKTSCHC